jgi:hypothetical protein
VTPERVRKIQQLAKQLLSRAYRNRQLIPARSLAGFCGLVQSCYLAIPAAQLFQRALHDDLSSRQSWSSKVRVSRQSLRDLVPSK